MPNRLIQFVNDVRDGKVKIKAVSIRSDAIIERIDDFSTNDSSAIVAEAYNRDIIDPDEISWNDAIKQVNAAMKHSAKS